MHPHLRPSIIGILGLGLVVLVSGWFATKPLPADQEQKLPLGALALPDYENIIVVPLENGPRIDLAVLEAMVVKKNPWQQSMHPSFEANDELFPTPSKLRQAVDFWVQVYSEWHKDEYIVHDQETFLVLARLDLSKIPEGGRPRQRVLENELKVYQQRMRALGRKMASGAKLEQLSKEEQFWAFHLGGEREERPYKKSAERLRVQRGQRNQFEAGLRRSGKYMPYIQQILSDRGLPPDLAYLPHVESSFNEKAISSDGASGIWQFMKSAAKGRLKINRDIDERNDPFRATEAAAHLLAHNYKRLGSWPLALTAYNHGLTGVLKARNAVGSNDLGEIAKKYSSKTFAFASKNFYACFLAARHVAQEASGYFPDLVFDPPLLYSSIKLPQAMTMAAAAKKTGLDRTALENLNLGLHRDIRQGKRPIPAGYEMKIPLSPEIAKAKLLPPENPATEQEKPQQEKTEAIAPQEAIAQEKTEAIAPQEVIAQEKTEAIAPQEAIAQEKTEAVAVAQNLVHTIKAGETLSAVAKRYKTSVKKIQKANALRSKHKLKIGQKIQIPTES